MAARNQKPSRRPGGRTEKPVYLIVCEGETEYNYFKEIRKHYRAQWIEPRKSDQPNPKGIIECARRFSRELATKGLDVRVWVVFDAESIQDEVERKYREAIAQAMKAKMNVANSSPCFEYWLLLHFAPGVVVTEPDQAERELGKKDRIPGYDKPNMPFGVIWSLYETGTPSKASRDRREDISVFEGDPRFGRPVTYVDVLVDELVAVAEKKA